jgi:hypothetical protein
MHADAADWTSEVWIWEDPLEPQDGEREKGDLREESVQTI